MILALIFAIIGGLAPSGPPSRAVGTLSIDGAQQWHCTAVLVGPGMALTARHCIDFAADFATKIDGQKSAVVAIYRPEGGDAALLALDPAPVAPAIPALLGQSAVSTGSVVTLAGWGATAWALRTTTTTVTFADPASYIQFEAGHVGLADSGGAVFLREGVEWRVVGVIVGTTDATNLARYASDQAFVSVSAPWSGRER